MTKIKAKTKSFQKLRPIALIGVLSLIVSSCVNNQSSETEKKTPLVKVKNLIPKFDQNTRISSFKSTDGAFRITQIGNNASGITWDPYLNQYLILQNNSAFIYRFNKDFEFLGKLRKVGNFNNDTEGLTFIDGQSVMIATEANTLHRIALNSQVFERGYYNANLNLRLSGRSKVKNKGIESVAYRVASIDRKARFYAAIEGTARHSEAEMKVMYIDGNVQSNFMGDSLSYEHDLQVIEPFNAESVFAGVITDIAGMTFDPTGETLIIVSQESKKAIQVNPDTGEILSQLKLSGAPVYEGVTIGPDGELIFVSEKNWVQVYTNNKD